MERKFTLWLTGLPGTGKTTITKLLEKQLLERGLEVELLDEDVIHTTLNNPSPLGQERRGAYTVAGDPAPTPRIPGGLARIVDVASPRREARQKADRGIGDFIKIFVTDPSGDAVGEMAGFAGTAGPSEEPVKADLVVEADQESPEESARKILHSLEERGYLPRMPAAVVSYSEEEEAAVRQRLEDLGYL